MSQQSVLDVTSRVLKVHQLSFSYPQRHVLTHWSHDFLPGITWIQGPNGCGKSTLLRLLAGALPPLNGSVQVDDIDLHAQPLKYRRQVYYCGPGPIAFDHLCPEEYFGFMRSLFPCVDEEALLTHVDGFGILPFLREPLAALSTGTQRKVWLAMALSAGTRVTLMDEPFNALDSLSAQHLREVLRQQTAQDSRIWIVASHEDLDLPGPAFHHLALP